MPIKKRGEFWFRVGNLTAWFDEVAQRQTSAANYDPVIDRILSSHSQVISMGELAYFGLFLKQAAGTSSPFVLDAETLGKAPQIDLAAVGQSYLEATARLRASSPNFIDKMPLNLFYAPLLLAAFPNARVVCLKRGPMDTCVSNFKQLFSTSYSYYNYSY